LLLSRWKATDLFLKDIQVLVSELSMVVATPELLALVGEEGAAEPYRYLMKNLRSRLMATHLECCFASAKHQLIECEPQRICRLAFSAAD
ncbi:hypothetical protein SB781_35425, partial [Paraburkholderia sp. SIMBA_061]